MLVFIPTYNEHENVKQIYQRIQKLGLDADVLFLDDNSPDGTGRLLDEIAASDASVQVIHRAGKEGIGSAHSTGIRWAYEKGYQTLVTMDCDFTHQPEAIPDFLRDSENHDVVVGSRFMKSDSLKDWNLLRKSMTFTGHFLTKHLLKMPQDASGAFRVYRLDRIPANLFAMVRAQGYGFFFESLHLLSINSFSICEIPIVLPARVSGHSKMTVAEAWKGLSFLAQTSFERITDRKKFILPRTEQKVYAKAGR